MLVVSGCFLIWSNVSRRGGLQERRRAETRSSRVPAGLWATSLSLRSQKSTRAERLPECFGCDDGVKVFAYVHVAATVFLGSNRTYFPAPLHTFSQCTRSRTEALVARCDDVIFGYNELQRAARRCSQRRNQGEFILRCTLFNPKLVNNLLFNERFNKAF